MLRWNGAQSAWEANFPGTTGSTTFALLADGNRALRLAPSGSTDVPNVVAGSSGNALADGPKGSVIGGGGSSTRNHVVSDDFCVVGGGEGNIAGDEDGNAGSADHATVGGGVGNTASGSESTVAGGSSNRATNLRTTVSGGQNNLADSNWATVCGGIENEATGEGATITGGGTGTVGGVGHRASGNYATISGGFRNVANAAESLAAGRRAKTASGDANSFTWNDGSEHHSIDSTVNDQGFSSAKDVDGEPVTGAETFNASASGGGSLRHLVVDRHVHPVRPGGVVEHLQPGGEDRRGAGRSRGGDRRRRGHGGLDLGVRN